jgi:hypothetical protein
MWLYIVSFTFTFQLSIMDKKLDQLVYLLNVQTHRQQFPALEEQV